MNVMRVGVLFRAWDGQPSEDELQWREDKHVRSPGTLYLHDGTPGATSCAGVGVHDIFGANSTSHEAGTAGKPGFISGCSGKSAIAFNSLPADQIEHEDDNVSYRCTT